MVQIKEGKEGKDTTTLGQDRDGGLDSAGTVQTEVSACEMFWANWGYQNVEIKGDTQDYGSNCWGVGSAVY